MKHSDLAIDKNGDLLVLASSDMESGFTLTRCNSAGQPLSVITIDDQHRDFPVRFCPTSLVCCDSLISLTDRERGLVVVIDAEGRFVEGRQLSSACTEAFCGEVDYQGVAVRCERKANPFRQIMRMISRALLTITKPSYSCNENVSANLLFFSQRHVD